MELETRFPKKKRASGPRGAFLKRGWPLEASRPFSHSYVNFVAYEHIEKIHASFARDFVKEKKVLRTGPVRGSVCLAV